MPNQKPKFILIQEPQTAAKAVAEGWAWADTLAAIDQISKRPEKAVSSMKAYNVELAQIRDYIRRQVEMHEALAVQRAKEEAERAQAA